MTSHWRNETISDVVYRTKFNDLPHIIADWLSGQGSLACLDILDFGCGEATTALSLALRYPDARVVGVDVMPDFTLCPTLARAQIALETLPDNLTLHQIRPGALHNETDRFDLIYSWSVFEHVEDHLLPATLAMLRSRLKPSGRLFIQICPLFHSEGGSHLLDRIPEPWGHLLHQHNVYLDKLQRSCNSAVEIAALRWMFETLNRLTGDELVTLARDAVFSVVREHRTNGQATIPRRLLQIYRPEILLNEQIVLLLEPV